MGSNSVLGRTGVSVQEKLWIVLQAGECEPRLHLGHITGTRRSLFKNNEISRGGLFIMD
jgi:hypothetical protein